MRNPTIRAMMTEFLIEHSQHTLGHINSLSDKDLLELYNSTRDTLHSIETL